MVGKQDKSKIADIIRYHEISKHQVNRYAPGPGELDWVNQPDPFRSFDGSAKISLPLLADTLNVSFSAISRGTTVPCAPLNLASIAILFELSLGLSAWKVYGDSRWALRCNPSSGNLHPTEAYLVCGKLSDLGPGTYHYLSRDHALEVRATPDITAWPEYFSEQGIVVGLSSIFWREAWKYGIRAYRYCQHDCGHAIAALSYAAASLGWNAWSLDDWGDNDIEMLLGLDRKQDFIGAEKESPEILLWISPQLTSPSPENLIKNSAAWSGHANRLSVEHVQWNAIDIAASAAAKPRTSLVTKIMDTQFPALPQPPFDLSAAQIFRRRRSAVRFDAKSTLTADKFFGMLDALLVRPRTAPWCGYWGRPLIHAALMVHRVIGLEPGLYVLCRAPNTLAALKREIASDALWSGVPSCPAHIPLYLLAADDLRSTAQFICCHQEIAGDSFFSMGFLAEFRDTLDQDAWWYRRLFWEAGFLGQILYLESEAAGMRATGIGCFFDDAMHKLLGLNNNHFQSIYHFTVGKPIDDARLMTLPPYAHLAK